MANSCPVFLLVHLNENDKITRMIMILNNNLYGIMNPLFNNEIYNFILNKIQIQIKWIK